jgi:membrane protease YdiL (CAAX protease family)
VLEGVKGAGVHRSTMSTALSRLRPLRQTGSTRLRAGWRAVLPVLGLLVVASLVGAAARDLPMPYRATVVQLGAAAVTVVVFVAWARYVDHRPLAAYGLRVGRAWVADLAAGALVAAGVVVGSVATAAALGWVEVTGVAVGPTGSFAPAFAAFLASWVGVAVWEELAFRGLFLTNAAEGFRRWLDGRAAVLAAWVVVSLVFGVLHLDQAPTPASLLLWVAVGAVPGLAYVLSGELAYALGFHFAVDATVNAGFNLAGADGVPSLLALAQTGPDAMVGVTGFVTVAWLLLAVPLTLAWAAARHGLAVDERVGGR